MEKDYKKLYEEEHKKYEDALGRAREHHSVASHYNNANEIQELEHIFPELKEKESEDERIRKELISLVKEIRVTDRFYDLNKMIAWLEKQGEQKSTDKVEPKFKIGDTIRPKGSMAEYTIESISGECYHGKGWGLSIGCDEDYELVEQKPSWSEEDETKLRTAQTFIRNTSLIEVDGIKEATIDWLKSLKDRVVPQNTWKPTEEQMEAVRIAAEIGTANNSWAMGVLKSMYQDLTKLKE